MSIPFRQDLHGNLKMGPDSFFQRACLLLNIRVNIGSFSVEVMKGPFLTFLVHDDEIGIGQYADLFIVRKVHKAPFCPHQIDTHGGIDVG